MNYKTIIYILALTLVSAIIGGTAVYLAINSRGKNNSVSETVNSFESLKESSAVKAISSIVEKPISSSAKLEEAPVKTEKSVIKLDEEKPTGQKFTGWLGSTDIEMYLNFKQDKITGKYYNSYDKKWYNLDGVYRDNIMGQPGQSGSIELNEFDGNLITGSLSFNVQNPTKFTNQNEQNNLYQGGFNYVYGIPAGVYYTNTIKTMGGYYSDKKFGNYDLFVSSVPADIDNFVERKLEAKVIKLDDGMSGNSTFFEQNGNYFFSYEDWMFKDLKVGDKVSIIGKIRSFNNSQSLEVQPWKDNNPGIYESTSQGIFQITDVKKI
jgi:hypothetical protein